MTETKTFAPDTNFFLQFKDPRELPWGELGDWISIRLVILEAVLGEIDNHKNGPKGRLSRKARNLHQKLRPLFTGGEDELVLRESGPQVLLQLGPDLSHDREPHPSLNYNKPDHQIIDEALASREQLAGLALLSDDGIATRKARSVGLEVHMLPDGWRLDPEPDESQRRIQELERQVAALTTQAPILSVSLIQDDKEVDEFRGTIQRFNPMSEQFLEKALEAVKEEHPPHQNVLSQATYGRHRRNWESNLQRRLIQHARLAFLAKSLTTIEFRFDNTGTVPAEALDVSVKLEGPFFFVDEDELARTLRDKKWTFASPPEPVFNSSYDSFGYQGPEPPDFDFFNDPMELGLFVDKPELASKSASGGCKDFRHRIGGVERELRLTIPESFEGDQANGRIIVRISAKNLPEPVVRYFPIRIDFEWLEAEDDARAQLANDLGVLVLD